MVQDVHSPPARVARSEDLGRAGRPFDLLLAWSALLPLFLLAGAASVRLTGDAPAWVRTLAAIWSGALLCFFSGVRRGLTFSERDGARPHELLAFLSLFFWGVLTLVFRSPLLGAVGLAANGAQAAWAGRWGEAPAYFARLRPMQMGLAAAALAWTAWRTAGA